MRHFADCSLSHLKIWNQCLNYSFTLFAHVLPRTFNIDEHSIRALSTLCLHRFMPFIQSTKNTAVRAQKKLWLAFWCMLIIFSEIENENADMKRDVENKREKESLIIEYGTENSQIFNLNLLMKFKIKGGVFYKCKFFSSNRIKREVNFYFFYSQGRFIIGINTVKVEVSSPNQ